MGFWCIYQTKKLCEKDGSAQVYYGMLMARKNGIFLLHCTESFTWIMGHILFQPIIKRI